MRWSSGRLTMSNVKTQMTNECQMPNVKRRSPLAGGLGEPREGESHIPTSSPSGITRNFSSATTGRLLKHSPLPSEKTAAGDRVICETKRMWSHLFLGGRREGFPNFPLSRRPLGRASPYTINTATMQICRRDYPVSGNHSVKRVFQQPPGLSLESPTEPLGVS